jgi:hypothetical protein
LIVVAESGASFSADLVILAIGVRPETELAKAAGLEIGSRGGIVVDAQIASERYFATRFLMQHGYRSRNLSGGYTTYQAFSAVGRNP